MSDRKKKLTRRGFIIGAATGAAGAATALQDGNKGNLTGGAMALSEPFNVSGKLWIGPDSAKSQVEAKSGRVYMAADTDVDYYADSGSWVTRSVGSSQVPVPSINTGQILSNKGATLNLSRYNPHPYGAFNDINPKPLKHLPEANNPALTPTDWENAASTSETFGTVGFPIIADVFVQWYQGKYHIFHEVKHDGGQDIGHSTSIDGKSITPDQIVLANGDNLSYPQFFVWDGQEYLSVNNGTSSSSLYKFDNFPTSLTKVHDYPASIGEDATWFYWAADDQWWILSNGVGADEIRFHTTPSVESSTYTEATFSPATAFSGVDGGGGQPIHFGDDAVDVFLEDASVADGYAVQRWRITDLSDSSIAWETAGFNPVIQRADGDGDYWMDEGAHHISQAQSPTGGGMVVFDGKSSENWSLGVGEWGDIPDVAARLGNNNGDTIPNASFTQVTWQTTDHNRGGVADKANDQFVAPVSGLYRVAMSVRLSLSATARIVSRINVAGTTKAQADDDATNSNNLGTGSVSADLYVEEGEAVTFDIFQNSGGNATIDTGGELTFCEMRLVQGY